MWFFSIKYAKLNPLSNKVTGTEANFSFIYKQGNLYTNSSWQNKPGDIKLSA